MIDGRHPLAHLVFPGQDHQHVARWIGTCEIGNAVKEFARAFFQDDGRKGAEWLAKFDLAVDDVLHLSASRIRQDAAIAERTRPPLKTSLEPSNHFARHQIVYQSVTERLIVCVALIADALSIQEATHLWLCIAAAQI